ncbi:Os03g0679800, partial [Oryza sativa Japonica Group]
SLPCHRFRHSRTNLAIPFGETHGGQRSTVDVRWILDFAAGGLDDDDDFLFHATEELEWSHYKAKRRASASPPPP